MIVACSCGTDVPTMPYGLRGSFLTNLMSDIDMRATRHQFWADRRLTSCSLKIQAYGSFRRQTCERRIMSSSIASTSRLSLQDWNTLAPLDDLENDSVTRIQTKLSTKSIPSHVGGPTLPYTLLVAERRLIMGMSQLLKRGTTRGDDTPATTTRNKSRNDLTSLTSRPTSAAGFHDQSQSHTISTTASNPLEISRPIETPQQFHDWFSLVATSLETDQEAVYRTHLAELTSYVERCGGMLEGLEDVRGLLSEMEANYRFVEENSRTLQGACETMLDEQVCRILYCSRSSD